MKYIFCITFLLFYNFSCAQITYVSVKHIIEEDFIELSYSLIDSQGNRIPFHRKNLKLTTPSYPGGWDSLKVFVSRNLKYPESAKQDSLEGRVWSSFIINKEGKIMDPEIINGVRSDIDSVCIALIQSFPDFVVPKSYRDETLRFRFFLRFIFNFKLSR